MDSRTNIPIFGLVLLGIVCAGIFYASAATPDPFIVDKAAAVPAHKTLQAVGAAETRAKIARLNSVP